MAWKKIIFSGSSAELNSVYASNSLTSSNGLFTDLTIINDTTIGNDNTDILTINADINSNVIPGLHESHDLGSTTQAWDNLYVKNISASAAITASEFKGDGSGLTNVTVAQVATVSSTFTNQTSIVVNHNFDTKNIQVQVFNDSDQLIIPATVTLTDSDNVTITFDSSTSGHAVVARGGHIVSGSVEFNNITDKPTLLSGSAEGDAQGQIKLNGVNVNVNDLGTNDSPTFTNLTLSGDLTVQGTTTTIDSTTLDIGDNIIALNGTGATLGGLHVNDANGPLSGSFLWDGTNNQWIAGQSGSEVKVLLAEGDSIVSASGQIALSGVTGDTDDVSEGGSNLYYTDDRVKTKLNTEGVISSSAQLQDDFLDTLGDGVLSGSGQIAQDISGSFTDTSASIAADIAGITTSFTLAADTGTNDSFNSGETLTFSGDNSISTAVSDNEITISIANGVISSSAQVDADNVTNFDSNVKAKINADNVISSSNQLTDVFLQIDGQGVISASAEGDAQGQVKLNGVNVDVNGLQTGDSPSFTNLTVNGDLTVTGNTFEAQVTNLNVEDKFIIVNSGSNSGDSGIIFGGSDPEGSGAANSGSAIFWDGDTDVFGFAQDLGSSATSAAVTSKLGNIETNTSDPSSAPTFQGTGTLYINESSETVWIYS